MWLQYTEIFIKQNYPLTSRLIIEKLFKNLKYIYKGINFTSPFHRLCLESEYLRNSIFR